MGLMKGLELSDSGSGPGRWHRHLLEIPRNDAELSEQRHGERGLCLEGGPSNPVGLRSRPQAPRPCASDSKRPYQTSIAARSYEYRGYLRYRTEIGLVHSEKELQQSELTGHTTGAAVTGYSTRTTRGFGLSIFTIRAPRTRTSRRGSRTLPGICPRRPRR